MRRFLALAVLSPALVLACGSEDEESSSCAGSACAGSAAISTEMAENLEDALEFIASLRIQHQAQQIRLGKAPDNYVPPGELSELEREHLKHAFKVIQSMQETMVKRFGADKLG